MSEVITVQDLETLKKHEIFEAEVITGKIGGLSTGLDIDFATNQATGQVQKTMPAILRDIGFSQASFDFTTGGTLGVNDRDKAVFDPISKAWYTWLGALPEVVPPGYNPVGDLDWKPWTDPTLRNEVTAYRVVSFVSVPAMVAGTPHGGGTVTFLDGDEYTTGATRWRVSTNTAGESLGGGLYAEPLTSICIDDYAFSPTVDCSIKLQAILVMASAFGIGRVYSNGGKTYKVENIIDFRGLKTIELDFGWSTLDDNVQGFLPPEVGSRAKQTFVLYDCNGSTLRRINWVVNATRASNADFGVPDILVWLGGQNEGLEITTNVEVSDILFTQTRIGMCPIGVLGELRGCLLRNIDIYGDASYGVNFEYGEPPVDIAIEPGIENGKHPYNCKVENFNGYELHNCVGFLRVAGCYNIEFNHCQGFNVKSFIYCYTGDQGIARVGENVVFNSCKNKNYSESMPITNNCVWIYVVNKDGSAGTPMPPYINLNCIFTFNDCEFWNNDAAGGACLRFFGNKGKTVFNSCTFRDSPRGLFIAPGDNPDYFSDYSLTFNECIFKGNISDVYAANINGLLFNHCTFKEQHSVSSESQVNIDGTTKNVMFRHCFFSGQQADRPYIATSVLTTNFALYDNEFLAQSTAYSCLSLGRQAKGTGNFSNGILLTNASKKIYGQKDAESKVISSAGTWNFEDTTVALIVASIGSLNGITGGKQGEILTIVGLTGSAAYTLTHSSVSVGVAERILTKTGADSAKSGRVTVNLLKQADGWYEM